ncbi:MAG: pSer/pThr/pTyr-binding forkhead associated (FHA) protein [Saprospiraceae bacterium]
MSDFQLDETIAKKTIGFSSTEISLSAIELETTDRRVQNSEDVFRIKTSVSLGRHPDCGIVLFDKNIPRFHARIFREGDKMFISDENSSNGTFWND